MQFLSKLFGDPNKKVLNSLYKIVEEINKLEIDFKNKTDDELRALTIKLMADCPREDNELIKKYLDSILPQAFALVREASFRVTGQRHYDVQLIGGIVLHQGNISEMKTGEGKTLVATLPLFLNALTGKGVHLVTVNDYLARVGAGWMAPTYHFLGLTTSVIIHEGALVYDPDYIDESQFDSRLKHFRSVSRKEAYACHITYGTNNEFGFDYLRDNMAPTLEAMVQRDLYYAIVDEVDSILIDEARTPLIISAPAQEATDKYYKFAELVGQLKENEDYNLDEKMKTATLSEVGISKMEQWLGVDNIYTTGGMREVHHIEQALKAHVLFKRDRDYVVREGEVIIVDEFTGRLMNGRRYSDGLHQAIEAKENVEIQRESLTLATVTFQNYFRLYVKLAGMTGTAMTEAEEFHKIYNLNTIVIPTHKAVKRQDLNDLIYVSEEGKYKAIVEDVKKRNLLGQPILIGTVSIEKSEKLLNFMEKEGLRPVVLNAKNHEKEAQIIANAGKLGAITIATNMAGRGVDIMLGGAEPIINNETTKNHDELLQAWKNEHDKVINLGGLHVIGTERHEARRIDNQLRGRSGRQGDPGSSQFYLSTDDDLMRIFGGDRMKNIMKTLKMPEDLPIENKIISRSIESAQKKVEGNNFDTRKHLLEYDDVINKHREAIYRRRKEILSIKNYQLRIKNDEIINNGEVEKENQEKQLAFQKMILEMFEKEIELIVNFHTLDENIEQWNLKEIKETVKTILSVPEILNDQIDNLIVKNDLNESREKIKQFLIKEINQAYQKLSDQAYDLGLNWAEAEKNLLLRSIDNLWIEHLSAVSALRQGIGLRGWGQRDPLVEYKKESYLLFKQLEDLIQKEVVYNIFKIGNTPLFNPVKKEELKVDNNEVNQNNINGEKHDLVNLNKKMQLNALDLISHSPIVPINQNATEAKNKISPNDYCSCGSGSKYRKCCGKEK